MLRALLACLRLVFKMNSFSDPTDRVHCSTFSYASCDKTNTFSWHDKDDEDDNDDVDVTFSPKSLYKLPFDGLVPYFTKYNHPNLPIAVCHLMKYHNVRVTCSKTVLEDHDSYWTTGIVSNENYCKIANVDWQLVLSPVGHLEQLLSAGLACVYKNGAKEKSSTKKQPHFFSIGYVPPNDIQVYFKFQNQTVCIQLADWGEPDGSGACDLVIHIAAGSF